MPDNEVHAFINGLECEWQHAQLPDSIHELVLDNQRVRHDFYWSVLD